MIEIGDRDVKDMRIGESVIYRDSDGWIPLKMPDDVTDGLVMFRDNHDGTASLVGAVTLPLMVVNQRYQLLLPPSGYAFISDNWTGPSVSGSDGKNEILAIPGYGQEDSSNFGSMFAAMTEYVGGVLVLHSVYEYPGYQRGGCVRVVFSDFMSHPDGTGKSMPLKINIQTL